MKTTDLTNHQEFFLTLQLSKTIIFYIEYSILGNNENPRFVTSAAQFNRPKSDYIKMGQCQDDLLPDFKLAFEFYQKWNFKHSEDLNTYEYEKMILDIKLLSEKYNYILDSKDIDFFTLKEFSKQELKEF
jgi:hypothetical protein